MFFLLRQFKLSIIYQEKVNAVLLTLLFLKTFDIFFLFLLSYILFGL